VVRDSGIGIGDEVMAGLFEPFTQADGSTTRLFGGTGLGLCISRRLAGMMHGSLGVVSRLDNGSEFTLLLPLERCRPSETGRIRHNEPTAVRGHYTHGRVMVVDDDSTNRWLTQRQLEWLGLSVDVAENGEAALNRLSHGEYVLLITDCHMPRMDGIALSRAIRTSSETRLAGLPIIGLTADVTSVQRDRCFASGMNEVLIKPINIERMSQVVSIHLPLGSTAAFNLTHVVATEDGEAAVFDDCLLRDLFGTDDPDGQKWLADYLEIAETLTEQLCKAALQVPACLDHPAIDRRALADLAHRLAGASLSVGAVKLGRTARALEQAALATQGAGADVVYQTTRQVAEQFGEARAVISALLAKLQPVASASS
jgi:CheY-like chemotaxis protein